MNCELLIDELDEIASHLEAGTLAEDYRARLTEKMRQAIQMLADLRARGAIADDLMGLFRNDLLSRARAVSKLTGRDLRLIERLIASEDLSLAELLNLRNEVDAAFDSAFRNSLRNVTPLATEDADKLSQFKVG